MSFCSARCSQVKDMRTGGLQRDNLSFCSLCLSVSSRLCCPVPTKQTHRSDDPGLESCSVSNFMSTKHRTVWRSSICTFICWRTSEDAEDWFLNSAAICPSSLRFSWLSRPQPVEGGGQGVVLLPHTQRVPEDMKRTRSRPISPPETRTNPSGSGVRKLWRKLEIEDGRRHFRDIYENTGWI